MRASKALEIFSLLFLQWYNNLDLQINLICTNLTALAALLPQADDESRLVEIQQNLPALVLRMCALILPLRDTIMSN